MCWKISIAEYVLFVCSSNDPNRSEIAWFHTRSVTPYGSRMDLCLLAQDIKCSSTANLTNLPLPEERARIVCSSTLLDIMARWRIIIPRCFFSVFCGVRKLWHLVGFHGGLTLDLDYRESGDGQGDHR